MEKMTTVIVRVTRKHQRNGTIAGNYDCPVALAMLDAGVILPNIGLETFSVAHHGQRFLTPAPVQKWIRSNISGGRPRPITFKVRIPASAVKTKRRTRKTNAPA